MRLHDTKEKKAIQAILNAGQATDFWLLLVESMQDSIDNIQLEIDGPEIAELPPDQYKVMAEILKGRKSDIRKLMELPGTIVEYLDNPDQTEPNFDPYSTEDDLEEEVKEEFE